MLKSGQLRLLRIFLFIDEKIELCIANYKKIIILQAN